MPRGQAKQYTITHSSNNTRLADFISYRRCSPRRVSSPGKRLVAYIVPTCGFSYYAARRFRCRAHRHRVDDITESIIYFAEYAAPM